MRARTTIASCRSSTGVSNSIAVTFSLEGLTLRANLLNREDLEFGPLANLTFGRDKDVSSTVVRQLGTIDDAYEAGVFGAFAIPVGGSDRIRIAVQGALDVSGVHDGYVLSATAAYTTTIGSRGSLSFDVGASYADDGYARTYFGVTAAGSAASGLASFAAKGGLKDVGGSVTASYRIGSNWSLVGYAGYKHLMGDFADSPIVKGAGNANQLSGGLGIAFAF